MLNNRIVQELSQRLAELIPAAKDVQSDLRTKIEQALKNGLQDLDVMTREEFDSQAQSLQRATIRVAELEVQLAEMERRLAALEGKEA